MKNTRKKMLLSSIAMLLVALVALGSATYAWFTINREVEAKRIEVRANVADGLIITNSKSASTTDGDKTDWDRTVQYQDTYQELNPVSFDITATDGSADMPSKGYYFKDVKHDGAIGTGKHGEATTSSVAEADLPSNSTNKTGQTLLYNDNKYAAAYTMKVASSGAAIKKNVTAEIKATGTTNKDGTKFAKAALVKGGKVIGFYSDDQYYPITSAGAVKDSTVAAEKKTEITALSSVNPISKADTFTLYVWYEGNDDDCVNNAQGFETNFTVTFTLAD